MRRFSIVVLALVVALSLVGTAIAAPNNSRNFKAHLTGDQESTPNDSKGQGQAHFMVSKDGSSIEYKLNVANIENVVASHIHCGAIGVSGPVGVSLFGPASAGGGPVNGTLAQGTISAPNPSNGCGWTSLADVVTAMESGNTYVNVHTNDGIGSPNTGPGDLASGEIRGQIR